MFEGFCRDFDEHVLIPRVFHQFERDFTAGLGFEKLMEKHNLSLHLTQRLIKLCKNRAQRRGEDAEASDYR